MSSKLIKHLGTYGSPYLLSQKPINVTPFAMPLPHCTSSRGNKICGYSGGCDTLVVLTTTFCFDHRCQVFAPKHFRCQSEISQRPNYSKPHYCTHHECHVEHCRLARHSRDSITWDPTENFCYHHLITCQFPNCGSSLISGIAREKIYSGENEWFCDNHTCATAFCLDRVAEVRAGFDILHCDVHTCVVAGCWKEVRAMKRDGKMGDGKRCEQHGD